MENTNNDLFERLKSALNTAGGMAKQGLDRAGKKTGEAWDTTKLRWKLSELQWEVKQLYGELGRSAFAEHLTPGSAKVKPEDLYAELDKKHIEMELLKREVKQPFVVTGTEDKFDVIARVAGGGSTGQAGALRHGISRALCLVDEEAYRPVLKSEGYLTRDPRMKERKKYGLKKARRASQFSKR